MYRSSASKLRLWIQLVLSTFLQQQTVPTELAFQLSNPYRSATRNTVVVSPSRATPDYYTLPKREWMGNSHTNAMWRRSDTKCHEMFDYHQRVPDTTWNSRENTIYHRHHALLYTRSDPDSCWSRDSLDKTNITRRRSYATWRSEVKSNGAVTK